MKFKVFILLILAGTASFAFAANLEDAFRIPPKSAQPGVYWYFMDGNLDGDEMVKDLESMKEVGIGNLVFLEVNVGVPRGPVNFMSDQWQGLFVNAVRQAERLGIDITLGAGPGWTGSGGPWVKPEQSMQHLVFSIIETKGPATFDGVLPVPSQRSTRWHKMRSPFYEDVVVYAFPKCAPVIDNINEKALFERNPYTSMPGVKPYLPAPVNYPQQDTSNIIDPDTMIDLTGRLQADGRLRWAIPAGEWTIMRMGRRSTGASTRPAPAPGVGFDHDKFDKAALEHHFDNYYGKLLKKVGTRAEKHGWTTVHLDSWEMGAQNWTPTFREEFTRRHGYDPQPFLVTFSGRAVKSVEVTERFLWDVRLTAQELVLENYAGYLKTLGHKHGFELSIEPYDMNPCADLDLGAVADVPMCEFWGAGFGFDSSFSCIEATSIAHTMGRSIVSAEAFTGQDKWQQYPCSMKNQGDWAFCMGINRFVYHTFAHKPLGEEYRPGMTMGPYGVHWDRDQTWWPMVKDYHKYVTRCSHLLRQGVTVSDILYLTPEGAPHVFRAPASALHGSGPLADKKGYGFDGCSPNILMDRSEVKNGRIAFPGGTSYRLMVLPEFETMTPKLLMKITELVKTGATIIGSPPVKSPSLSGYPKCDDKVRKLAKKLWGTFERPAEIIKRKYGQGTIYFGGPKPKGLYPDYDSTALVMKQMGVNEDFTSTGPVRYGHRTTKQQEIYFVSNKSGESIQDDCTFRVGKSKPQLWNPVTSQRRILPQYKTQNGLTTIPLEFAPYESYFVIFPHKKSANLPIIASSVNFPATTLISTLEGAWDVSFDPKWGGPEKVTFNTLDDWTSREESGIKYYSGMATYKKNFEHSHKSGNCVYLDLGTVHDMARIKLNGKELGVVWCAPWRVDITEAVKAKSNILEIDIANRWPNRLLGDQQAPDRDVRTVQWECGFLEGKEYKTGRYTFTTGSGPGKLLPSGLLGPVRILVNLTERK
ncbi:MAG: glycosyl hydrolase [Planctomycetes bacterium]|nr:glycosyl hydrolase [Planctomycetota bacterium]